MKIGFLDSGIGGLSVLHHAFRVLPKEQFLYYADEEHVPYGEKTQEEIVGFVENAVEFMIGKQVKAIVIACNTATSVAVNTLRKKYQLPIIGMEPAVKKAVDLYSDKRVFVTATPITVKGEKMRFLIDKVDKQHLVDLIALPKLVHFAENNIFGTDEIVEYLRKEFESYHLEDYGSLVLGCTHFNYFKDSFRTVLPSHIHFVDGVRGTLEQLIRKLNEYDLLEEQEFCVEYYSSGKQLKKEELTKIQSLFTRLDQMEQIL